MNEILMKYYGGMHWVQRTVASVCSIIDLGTSNSAENAEAMIFQGVVRGYMN